MWTERVSRRYIFLRIVSSILVFFYVWSYIIDWTYADPIDKRYDAKPPHTMVLDQAQQEKKELDPLEQANEQKDMGSVVQEVPDQFSSERLDNIAQGLIAKISLLDLSNVNVNVQIGDQEVQVNRTDVTGIYRVSIPVNGRKSNVDVYIIDPKKADKKVVLKKLQGALTKGENRIEDHLSQKHGNGMFTITMYNGQMIHSAKIVSMNDLDSSIKKEVSTLSALKGKTEVMLSVVSNTQGYNDTDIYVNTTTGKRLHTIVGKSTKKDISPVLKQKQQTVQESKDTKMTFKATGITYSDGEKYTEVYVDKKFQYAVHERTGSHFYANPTTRTITSVKQEIRTFSKHDGSRVRGMTSYKKNGDVEEFVEQKGDTQIRYKPKKVNGEWQASEEKTEINVKGGVKRVTNYGTGGGVSSMEYAVPLEGTIDGLFGINEKITLIVNDHTMKTGETIFEVKRGQWTYRYKAKLDVKTKKLDPYNLKVTDLKEVSLVQRKLTATINENRTFVVQSLSLRDGNTLTWGKLQAHVAGQGENPKIDVYTLPTTITPENTSIDTFEIESHLKTKPKSEQAYQENVEIIYNDGKISKKGIGRRTWTVPEKDAPANVYNNDGSLNANANKSVVQISDPKGMTVHSNYKVNVLLAKFNAGDNVASVKGTPLQAYLNAPEIKVGDTKVKLEIVAGYDKNNNMKNIARVTSETFSIPGKEGKYKVDGTVDLKKGKGSVNFLLRQDLVTKKVGDKEYKSTELYSVTHQDCNFTDAGVTGVDFSFDKDSPIWQAEVNAGDFKGFEKYGYTKDDKFRAIITEDNGVAKIGVVYASKRVVTPLSKGTTKNEVKVRYFPDTSKDPSGNQLLWTGNNVNISEKNNYVNPNGNLNLGVGYTADATGTLNLDSMSYSTGVDEFLANGDSKLTLVFAEKIINVQDIPKGEGALLGLNPVSQQEPAQLAIIALQELPGITQKDSANLRASIQRVKNNYLDKKSKSYNPLIKSFKVRFTQSVDGKGVDTTLIGFNNKGQPIVVEYFNERGKNITERLLSVSSLGKTYQIIKDVGEKRYTGTYQLDNKDTRKYSPLERTIPEEEQKTIPLNVGDKIVNPTYESVPVNEKGDMLTYKNGKLQGTYRFNYPEKVAGRDLIGIYQRAADKKDDKVTFYASAKRETVQFVYNGQQYTQELQGFMNPKENGSPDGNIYFQARVVDEKTGKETLLVVRPKKKQKSLNVVILPVKTEISQEQKSIVTPFGEKSVMVIKNNDKSTIVAYQEVNPVEITGKDAKGKDVTVKAFRMYEVKQKTTTDANGKVTTKSVLGPASYIPVDQEAFLALKTITIQVNKTQTQTISVDALKKKILSSVGKKGLENKQVNIRLIQQPVNVNGESQDTVFCVVSVKGKDAKQATQYYYKAKVDVVLGQKNKFSVSQWQNASYKLNIDPEECTAVYAETTNDIDVYKFKYKNKSAIAHGKKGKTPKSVQYVEYLIDASTKEETTKSKVIKGITGLEEHLKGVQNSAIQAIIQINGAQKENGAPDESRSAYQIQVKRGNKTFTIYYDPGKKVDVKTTAPKGYVWVKATKDISSYLSKTHKFSNKQEGHAAKVRIRASAGDYVLLMSVAELGKMKQSQNAQTKEMATAIESNKLEGVQLPFTERIHPQTGIKSYSITPAQGQTKNFPIEFDGKSFTFMVDGGTAGYTTVNPKSLNGMFITKLETNTSLGNKKLDAYYKGHLSVGMIPEEKMSACRENVVIDENANLSIIRDYKVNEKGNSIVNSPTAITYIFQPGQFNTYFANSRLSQTKTLSQTETFSFGKEKGSEKEVSFKVNRANLYAFIKPVLDQNPNDNFTMIYQVKKVKVGEKTQYVLYARVTVINKGMFELKYNAEKKEWEKPDIKKAFTYKVGKTEYSVPLFVEDIDNVSNLLKGSKMVRHGSENKGFSSQVLHFIQEQGGGDKKIRTIKSVMNVFQTQDIKGFVSMKDSETIKVFHVAEKKTVQSQDIARSFFADTTLINSIQQELNNEKVKLGDQHVSMMLTVTSYKDKDNKKKYLYQLVVRRQEGDVVMNQVEYVGAFNSSKNKYTWQKKSDLLESIQDIRYASTNRESMLERKDYKKDFNLNNPKDMQRVAEGEVKKIETSGAKFTVKDLEAIKKDFRIAYVKFKVGGREVTYTFLVHKDEIGSNYNYERNQTRRVQYSKIGDSSLQNGYVTSDLRFMPSTFNIVVKDMVVKDMVDQDTVAQMKNSADTQSKNAQAYTDHNSARIQFNENASGDVEEYDMENNIVLRHKTVITQGYVSTMGGSATLRAEYYQMLVPVQTEGGNIYVTVDINALQLGNNNDIGSFVKGQVENKLVYLTASGELRKMRKKFMGILTNRMETASNEARAQDGTTQKTSKDFWDSVPAKFKQMKKEYESIKNPVFAEEYYKNRIVLFLQKVQEESKKLIPEQNKQFNMYVPQTGVYGSSSYKTWQTIKDTGIIFTNYETVVMRKRLNGEGQGEILSPYWAKRLFFSKDARNTMASAKLDTTKLVEHVKMYNSLQYFNLSRKAYNTIDAMYQSQEEQVERVVQDFDNKGLFLVPVTEGGKVTYKDTVTGDKKEIDGSSGVYVPKKTLQGQQILFDSKEDAKAGGVSDPIKVVQKVWKLDKKKRTITDGVGKPIKVVKKDIMKTKWVSAVKYAGHAKIDPANVKLREINKARSFLSKVNQFNAQYNGVYASSNQYTMTWDQFSKGKKEMTSIDSKFESALQSAKLASTKTLVENIILQHNTSIDDIALSNEVMGEITLQLRTIDAAKMTSKELQVHYTEVYKNLREKFIKDSAKLEKLDTLLSSVKSQSVDNTQGWFNTGLWMSSIVLTVGITYFTGNPFTKYSSKEATAMAKQQVICLLMAHNINNNFHKIQKAVEKKRMNLNTLDALGFTMYAMNTCFSITSAHATETYFFNFLGNAYNNYYALWDSNWRSSKAQANRFHKLIGNLGTVLAGAFDFMNDTTMSTEKLDKLIKDIVPSEKRMNRMVKTYMDMSGTQSIGRNIFQTSAMVLMLCGVAYAALSVGASLTATANAATTTTWVTAIQAKLGAVLTKFAALTVGVDAAGTSLTGMGIITGAWGLGVAGTLMTIASDWYQLFKRYGWGTFTGKWWGDTNIAGFEGYTTAFTQGFHHGLLMGAAFNIASGLGGALFKWVGESAVPWMIKTRFFAVRALGHIVKAPLWVWQRTLHPFSRAFVRGATKESTKGIRRLFATDTILGKLVQHLVLPVEGAFMFGILTEHVTDPLAFWIMQKTGWGTSEIGEYMTTMEAKEMSGAFKMWGYLTMILIAGPSETKEQELDKTRRAEFSNQQGTGMIDGMRQALESIVRRYKQTSAEAKSSQGKSKADTFKKQVMQEVEKQATEVNKNAEGQIVDTKGKKLITEKAQQMFEQLGSDGKNFNEIWSKFQRSAEGQFLSMGLTHYAQATVLAEMVNSPTVFQRFQRLLGSGLRNLAARAAGKRRSVVLLSALPIGLLYVLGKNAAQGFAKGLVARGFAEGGAAIVREAELLLSLSKNSSFEKRMQIIDKLAQVSKGLKTRGENVTRLNGKIASAAETLVKQFPAEMKVLFAELKKLTLEVPEIMEIQNILERGEKLGNVSATLVNALQSAQSKLAKTQVLMNLMNLLMNVLGANRQTDAIKLSMGNLLLEGQGTVNLLTGQLRDLIKPKGANSILTEDVFLGENQKTSVMKQLETLHTQQHNIMSQAIVQGYYKGREQVAIIAMNVGRINVRGLANAYVQSADRNTLETSVLSTLLLKMSTNYMENIRKLGKSGNIKITEIEVAFQSSISNMMSATSELAKTSAEKQAGFLLQFIAYGRSFAEEMAKNGESIKKLQGLLEKKGIANEQREAMKNEILNLQNRNTELEANQKLFNKTLEKVKADNFQGHASKAEDVADVELIQRNKIAELGKSATTEEQKQKVEEQKEVLEQTREDMSAHLTMSLLLTTESNISSYANKMFKALASRVNSYTNPTVSDVAFVSQLFMRMLLVVDAYGTSGMKTKFVSTFRANIKIFTQGTLGKLKDINDGLTIRFFDMFTRIEAGKGEFVVTAESLRAYEHKTLSELEAQFQTQIKLLKTELFQKAGEWDSASTEKMVKIKDALLKTMAQTWMNGGADPKKIEALTKKMGTKFAEKILSLHGDKELSAQAKEALFEFTSETLRELSLGGINSAVEAVKSVFTGSQAKSQFTGENWSQLTQTKIYETRKGSKAGYQYNVDAFGHIGAQMMLAKLLGAEVKIEAANKAEKVILTTINEVADLYYKTAKSSVHEFVFDIRRDQITTTVLLTLFSVGHKDIQHLQLSKGGTCVQLLCGQGKEFAVLMAAFIGFKKSGGEKVMAVMTAGKDLVEQMADNPLMKQLKAEGHEIITLSDQGTTTPNIPKGKGTIVIGSYGAFKNIGLEAKSAIPKAVLSIAKFFGISSRRFMKRTVAGRFLGRIDKVLADEIHQGLVFDNPTIRDNKPPDLFTTWKKSYEKIYGKREHLAFETEFMMHMWNSLSMGAFFKANGQNKSLHEFIKMKKAGEVEIDATLKTEVKETMKEWLTKRMTREYRQFLEFKGKEYIKKGVEGIEFTPQFDVLLNKCAKSLLTEVGKTHIFEKKTDGGYTYHLMDAIGRMMKDTHDGDPATAGFRMMVIAMQQFGSKGDMMMYEIASKNKANASKGASFGIQLAEGAWGKMKKSEASVAMIANTIAKPNQVSIDVVELLDVHGLFGKMMAVTGTIDPVLATMKFINKRISNGKAQLRVHKVQATQQADYMMGNSVKLGLFNSSQLPANMPPELVEAIKQSSKGYMDFVQGISMAKRRAAHNVNKLHSIYSKKGLPPKLILTGNSSQELLHTYNLMKSMIDANSTSVFAQNTKEIVSNMKVLIFGTKSQADQVQMSNLKMFQSNDQWALEMKTMKKVNNASPKQKGGFVYSGGGEGQNIAGAKVKTIVMALGDRPLSPAIQLWLRINAEGRAKGTVYQMVDVANANMPQKYRERLQEAMAKKDMKSANSTYLEYMRSLEQQSVDNRASILMRHTSRGDLAGVRQQYTQRAYQLAKNIPYQALHIVNRKTMFDLAADPTNTKQAVNPELLGQVNEIVGTNIGALRVDEVQFIQQQLEAAGEFFQDPSTKLSFIEQSMKNPAALSLFFQLKNLSQQEKQNLVKLLNLRIDTNNQDVEKSLFLALVQKGVVNLDDMNNNSVSRLSQVAQICSVINIAAFDSYEQRQQFYMDLGASLVSNVPYAEMTFIANQMKKKGINSKQLDAFRSMEEYDKKTERLYELENIVGSVGGLWATRVLQFANWINLVRDNGLLGKVKSLDQQDGSLIQEIQKIAGKDATAQDVGEAVTAVLQLIGQLQDSEVKNFATQVAVAAETLTPENLEQLEFRQLQYQESLDKLKTSLLTSKDQTDMFSSIGLIQKLLDVKWDKLGLEDQKDRMSVIFSVMQFLSTNDVAQLSSLQEQLEKKSPEAWEKVEVAIMKLQSQMRNAKLDFLVRTEQKEEARKALEGFQTDMNSMFNVESITQEDVLSVDKVKQLVEKHNLETYGYSANKLFTTIDYEIYANAIIQKAVTVYNEKELEEWKVKVWVQVKDLVEQQGMAPKEVEQLYLKAKDEKVQEITGKLETLYGDYNAAYQKSYTENGKQRENISSDDVLALKQSAINYKNEYETIPKGSVIVSENKKLDVQYKMVKKVLVQLEELSAKEKTQQQRPVELMKSTEKSAGAYLKDVPKKADAEKALETNC